MSDTVKMRSRSPKAKHTAVRKKRPPAAAPGTRAVKACIFSFAAGVGLCAALLALFALLLANTPLPLTMVRPLACLAAAAGAALSGGLLARQIGRRMMLCGLGCGAFYAVCQIAASFLWSGELPLTGSEAMLPLALLLGGLAGGSAAALRAVR